MDMNCTRLLTAFIKIVCTAFFLTLLFPGISQAATTVMRADNSSAVSCPTVGDVTNQSLLIVLLDRSGSLIIQPGATDPNGYSTSITKALADLWPGKMAVIPFSGDATPVLGPTNLADQGPREQLKNAVQNYPISGNTPLDPALQKALALMNGAAPGSRVVIVTDGSPTPATINNVNQIDDITKNLIPKFCSKGVSVSAFGLTLDLTQSDGQIADHLLSTIARGTGGAYTNVRNTQDLAHVVIKLYADWQHLVFIQATTSNNGYAIPIDTYAKKIAFVTFRTDSNYKITLSGPSKQVIPNQVLQRSTDRHYEIDNLVVSAINQPGSYTIQVGGDSGAQAYALVETRLHAKLLKPDAQTTAYIGQSLQIEAQLVNDTTPIVPQANEATMNAHIVVQSAGQTSYSTDVELTQVKDNPSFTGAIKLPGPVGDITVTIEAVYRQIPVEASQAQITIPLKVAPAKPAPVKPVVVPACNLNCYWQRYSNLVIGALPILLLLLLFLFWRLRKGPKGILRQGHVEEQLAGLRRPLGHRLFQKSKLSAKELQDAGFAFADMQFMLDFSSGTCSVTTDSDTLGILIKKNAGLQAVTRTGGAVDLEDGDAIQVKGCPPATFKEDEDTTIL